MDSLNLQTAASAKMRAFVIVSLPLWLLVHVTACTQTPTPTVETVQFTVIADTSTAPLIDELATAFGANRPHVSIWVEHAANAERALESLHGSQTDLASVSWLPEDGKIDGTFWYHPFARDSIVMIAHPSNPIGGLTLPQLRSIFQGQTIFWTELGGPELDVVPVSREDGSGTRLSFESLVMGRSDVTPTAVVMPSSEAVVEYVATTPGAIGYVSTAWLSPAVNLLAVEGVTPSPTSVEDGRYVLARPYYLVAQTEPNGGVAQFVDWIREGEGHEIIRRNYAPAP
jgi:phosphate transport system substrate-binding protein